MLKKEMESLVEILKSELEEYYNDTYLDDDDTEYFRGVCNTLDDIIKRIESTIFYCDLYQKE